MSSYIKNYSVWNRINESAVVYSPDFIQYIKDQEGAVKDASGMHKAYQDSTGVWTIGYGHTGSVRPGDKWTEQKAEQYLKQDLQQAEGIVKNHVSSNFPGKILGTSQLQMLTDFAFNLGGLNKFPRFTTAIVNKDWKTAAENYKRYADGKELEKRNTSFYNKFLKPLLTGHTAKKTPGQYIGKTIYPKKENGYANVRDDNYVNNGWINNLVSVVNWPDSIGKVTGEATGEDGKMWYNVDLSDGGGDGWVRSDVIALTNYETYTVKSGDTLSGISAKTGARVDDIKRLNGLKNDLINPGQTLRLK
jgi:lysozyme